MSWHPETQEIEEKLIELAYVWGDIEERIEQDAIDEDSPISDEQFLAWAIGRAFRVEAQFTENGFGDPCTPYVLFFDVTDGKARDAANLVEASGTLSRMINDLARPWHSRDSLIVKRVAPSAPVVGQICRRLGEDHPPKAEPSLEDLPPEQQPQGAVGFEKRDVYWLTPIEAKFYDAVRDTGLFFAVQPWIQGTDRRYRPDFLFFYDGGGVAVELDGHDWHKTKEQRGYDAEKDRWFAERGIRTLRWTGSQVHADPQGCVSELLNVLRAASARP